MNFVCAVYSKFALLCIASMKSKCPLRNIFNCHEIAALLARKLRGCVQGCGPLTGWPSCAVALWTGDLSPRWLSRASRGPRQGELGRVRPLPSMPCRSAVARACGPGQLARALVLVRQSRRGAGVPAVDADECRRGKGPRCRDQRLGGAGQYFGENKWICRRRESAAGTVTAQSQPAWTGAAWSTRWLAAPRQHCGGPFPRSAKGTRVRLDSRARPHRHVQAGAVIQRRRNCGHGPPRAPQRSPKPRTAACNHILKRDLSEAHQTRHHLGSKRCQTERPDGNCGRRIFRHTSIWVLRLQHMVSVRLLPDLFSRDSRRAPTFAG